MDFVFKGEKTMKKKLLITLLASACAVGCAAGLAACGSGDNGGDGDKHMTDLVVSVGSTEHADSYDMGKYVYGSTTMPDLNSYEIYAKYSDDSKTKIEKSDSALSVYYTYNGAEISQLPASLGLGEYNIHYYYRNESVNVSFEVISSATASPYTVELSKTNWAYLEELPAATVKEGTTTLNSENYNLKYISEAKYDEIKNDDDFAEKLDTETALNSFSGDVAPGSYYVFAMAGPSQKYNSQFVKVTVNKADVTPSKTSGFAVTYNYDGNKIGDIKLSDVSLDLDVTFKDSNEYNVNGSLVWDTPEITLNSSNSGVTKVAKFVPELSEFYNEYELPEPVTVTINKCAVYVPSLYGGGTESATTWDGTSHDIKVDFAQSGYDIATYADITHNENSVTINEDVLGTATEIGDYVYTFSLKDKTNYYWSNANDVADKTLTYSIVGKEAWVSIGNVSSAILDANRKFKLLITTDAEYSGEEPYVCLTPYAAGTLNVEVVTDNTAQVNGSTYYQEIVGSAEIIEESGKTYLVITVDNFKDKVQDNQATLLRFTATGADHYADINTVNGSLNLNPYVAP